MIAAVLLLLAGQAGPAALPAPPPAVAGPRVFAPPLGSPMRYRVTTRRLSRDGTIASYTLDYLLQWERAGRGIRLVATLQRTGSDARPELAGAFTSLMQPLVGEPVTYLVAADGSSIDLVDPDGLWARVMAQTEAMAAAADQPEAKSAARLLAALSPGDREKLATADIRALVATANADIPASSGAGVAVRQDGNLRTIARTERGEVSARAGAPQPLVVERNWTVDTATGLLIAERRQSWLTGPVGDERQLAEEQIRELDADR